MMFTPLQIKNLALDLGVDLCGIAPVTRFNDAPEGFHPRDIDKQCRSVIVFAKQFPKQTLFASSDIPYTYAKNVLTQKIDWITNDFTLKLENLGIKATPIPSDDPYEYWEPEKTRGMGILSLRHAGYFAGLGVLGKNTLLMNERFGNMIQLGAVLVHIDLKGDPIRQESYCKPDCQKCIKRCPQSALNGVTVDQYLCRQKSQKVTEKGYHLITCHICRQVCPYFDGKKEKEV